MPDEEYLTLKQVARQLQVDDKTVRRYIKAGKIPAIEIGGRYRIAPADLRVFLESRRKKPDTPQPT